MPEDTKKPANIPKPTAERRSDPRYTFTAAAELIDEKSGTRIEARIANISHEGCYVETNTPFSQGTETSLRIKKEANTFVAQARVVRSTTKGMGLLFTAIAQEQLQVLESWLELFQQQGWLAEHRRRSQRIVMRIAVRVSGQNNVGSRFEEETHTLVINTNGALILLSTPVSKGQALKLVNTGTNDATGCVVAHIGQHQGSRLEVGVGFSVPNPKFWHVVFPPPDWTRPQER
jgi:hypothetical protein